MMTDEDKEALEALERGDASQFMGRLGNVAGGASGWVQRTLAEHEQRKAEVVEMLVKASNPALSIDPTKPLVGQDPEPLYNQMHQVVEYAFQSGAISMGLVFISWMQHVGMIPKS